MAPAPVQTVRIDGIPAQTIKIETATRPDLLQYVLGGIHLASGSSSGRARVWVMAYTATIVRELSFDNTSQKDDSIALEILPDGAVMITISEAGPDNTGASSQPVVVQVPGVFPPAPSGGTGGGGSTTNVDQVARDMATAAQNTATAAQGTANTALDKANKAQSTADSAKNTANSALSMVQTLQAQVNAIPIWFGRDEDWNQAGNRVFGDITANPPNDTTKALIRLINQVYDARESLPTAPPPAGRSAPSTAGTTLDDDDPERRQ